MREYSKFITLNNNVRGVYILDPTMGCGSGLEYDAKGCYNECYSARAAKKYGYDFSKTVLRDFKDEKHKRSIIRKINKIDQPFIRMGSNGDPSENWEHTLKICETIKGCNKRIVIITKHWNNLNDSQLKQIEKLNIIINTSVSALDNEDLLKNSLDQYRKLKKYCESFLRIVSCDFNKNNLEGDKYEKIQNELFKNENIIDTVLRVFKNNKLVTGGVIKIQKTKFLGKPCYVSKYNRKTYFGNCINCLEKCGVNM